MGQKVEEYKALKDEIFKIKRMVPMNFVAVDCSTFNDSLSAKIDSLIDQIVGGELKKNQDLIQ